MARDDYSMERIAFLCGHGVAPVGTEKVPRRLTEPSRTWAERASELLERVLSITDEEQTARAIGRLDALRGDIRTVLADRENTEPPASLRHIVARLADVGCFYERDGAASCATVPTRLPTCLPCAARAAIAVSGESR